MGDMLPKTSGRGSFFALLLVVLLTGLRPLNAVVNWHNDLAISTDVFNDDIDIQGTNQITASIHVVASTDDIVVSVTTDASTLFSEEALYFYAAADHIITVSLTEDLLFRGGATEDFLITFSGAGQLRFWIQGDHRVRFSSAGSSGGAQFFVLNSAVSPTNVLFSRFPLGSFGTSEQNLHASVEIGPRSVMSFAAQTAVSSGSATEQGTITFNPTNQIGYGGRLILSIEDSSSFVIQGCQVSTLDDPTLADFDMTTAAGLLSRVQIANSDTGGSYWSGLLVKNGNLTWNQLQIDPFCENNYTGTRCGFILGANGELRMTDKSYLDYVVTVTNVSLDPLITATVLNNPCQRFVGEIVKDRNPAALIVDGDTNLFASPAAISLLGDSAAYFRSAVNCDGISTFTVTTDQIISCTINPSQDIKTEGTILLDVEGKLQVAGSSGETALNILSLFVEPYGGPVLIEGTDTVFPLRTFAKDSEGKYLQYGSGCWMINNRMELIDTNLQHTDTNHQIYEDNLAGQSAPTYIGGEHRSLLCGLESNLQNTIAFYNSNFLLHTSAAFTGVDLWVPNLTTGPNNSFFTFCYNGRCIDQGTGRSLILGTDVGALAQNNSTIVNRDAHLNIIQDSSGPVYDQILTLSVAPNNSYVTEGLTSSITNQYSIQTLFLGNASNISIGTDGSVGTAQDGSTFPLTTFPTLSIVGDYFSFTTQGGTIRKPELSMSSGEGGMFVDANGTVTIDANARASFSLMVTKSRTGIIDLPRNQIFFGPRVGIAQWKVDLNTTSEQTLISASENLSDYTLDWKNISKDYCSSDVNVPYELSAVPAPGGAPAMTHQNLVGLPKVLGTVDQFQIKNSRIGDQAQLLVSGGLVRELVFLTGKAPATAPTGLLVVQDDAIVGLGTAHRTVDSLDASAMLGINGVTIAANGNGTIRLNEDTIVNNLCQILTGTSFGLEEPQQLVIDSAVPRELRIKSTGILDLTSFTNTSQQLVFGGQVRLVLEPGAQILMNGGQLIFSGQSIMDCTPFIDGDLPAGAAPSDTDSFRVKMIGIGRVTFKENAQCLVPFGSLLGIETSDALGITTTTQSWVVNDSAQILIGTQDLYGGAFQVGNAIEAVDAAVNFSLELNGLGATFAINNQGFVGFGVGVVDKQTQAPNSWRIDRLFNTGSISITVIEGTFAHQQIYSGSSVDAALLALGPISGTYTYSFDRTNAVILGGGNLLLASSSTGYFNPVIGTTDGLISSRYSAGIAASKLTLLDSSKVTDTSDPVIVSGSATTLFAFLKMNPYNAQGMGSATLSRTALGQVTAGYVDDSTIYRRIATDLRLGSASVGPERSLSIGAVGLGLGAVDRAPFYNVVNP